MKDTKTYYLYELRNDDDQVEYVGYTTKISGYRSRFNQHTRIRPGHNGSGKFYKRTDIRFCIVDQTLCKKEAMELEGKLKLSHGLEWTERTDQRNIEDRNRKLTQDQAEEIRSKYVPRKYSMMTLADEYAVSYGSIKQIINGDTYK